MSDFDFSELLEYLDPRTAAELGLIPASVSVSEPPSVAVIGREVMLFMRILDGDRYGCKVFRGPENTPFKSAQKGLWNRAELHAVNDLGGYHALIKRLAVDHKIYVLPWAELVDPKPERNKKILRRAKARADEPATIRGRKSYFLHIDIDGLMWEGLDHSDPEGAVRELRKRLKGVAGCGMSVALSGSWGVKPGFRGHVALEMEKPLSCVEAAKLAKSICDDIDPAIYRVAQPFYFANALFENGAIPPKAVERFHYLPGEVLHLVADTAYAELDYWLGKIKALEAGDGRHEVINKAGYYLGRFVGARVWSTDEVLERLISACEESEAFEPERVSEARDEIRRAIVDGMRNAPDDGVAEWTDEIIYSNDGKIKNYTANLLVVLRKHPKMRGKMRYNVRKDRIEWIAPPPWAAKKEGDRIFEDRDIIECCGWLNGLGLNLGEKTVYRSLVSVAMDTRFDNVVAALEGLAPWDKTPRLDTFLMHANGAPNDIYHTAVGKRTIFLGACYRAFNPGCKHDSMAIAIGAENLGKSLMFKDLFEWAGDGAFSDSPPEYADVKKMAEGLRGVWAVEDGELSKMSTREIESVKRAVSSQADKYRPAYGYTVTDALRRNIFLGSTNHAEPLSAFSGGNRRFHTFVAYKYDRKWVLENRDQLWAEALYLMRSGEQSYFTPEEEAARLVAQEDHTQSDDWTSAIHSWLAEPITDADGGEKQRDFVTGAEITMHALRIPLGQTGKAVGNRVAICMRSIGWDRSKRWINGVQVRGYAPVRNLPSIESLKKKAESISKRRKNEEAY